MKFTINCDCTPEEARQFFGLPDFQPMQEAVLSDMQEKMQKNMSAMDPENMMRMWFPQGAMGGMQAFTDLQKSIWEQMMGIANQSEAQPKKAK
jgi:uncharacterized protein DUF6489